MALADKARPTVAEDSIQSIYLDMITSAGYNSEIESNREHAHAVHIPDFERKTEAALRVIGPHILSSMVGAQSPTYLRRWAEGSDKPDLAQARRVCVAETIVQRFGSWFPDVVQLDKPDPNVQAWLLGQNPALELESPATIIRTQPFKVTAPKIASSLYDLIS